MPTPEPPVVDPRSSADLALELSRRARVDFPEWRPPAQGDPGTALQQALASMVGHLVERVNRVPTHAFRTFLQAAGIQTLAPHPAQAAVTFGLTPGQGATVVPAGTQVEAAGDATREAVVFETDADVTVLPMRLEALEVWDPVADRITTVGPTVDNGFAAFAGVAPVRHDLLVTSPSLLAAEPGSQVSLTLEFESSLAEQELADLVSTLSLAATNVQGLATPLAPSATQGPTATLVTLGATAASTGLGGAVHVVVGGTLAEHPFSRHCTVKGLQVTVTVHPRGVSSVAVDGAPVDPSLAFAPLGQVPHPGSEMAFADPVLGVPDATVRLDLVLHPGVAKSAVLVWEWYDGTSWHPLEDAVEDGTKNLTQSGVVTISTPGVPTAELGGTPGCWVRVRLVSGGYGRPRAYVPINPDDLKAGLKVEPGTGDLDAPRVLTVSVGADASDNTPEVSRRTGRHVMAAIGQSLTTGLDGLGAVSGTSGQTLVLGLAGDPGNRQVTLHLGLVDLPPPPRGRSGAFGRTAVQWEYLDGTQWQPLTVVDGTEGMTRTGVVSFLAPPGLAATALPGLAEHRWVRARALEAVAPRESPRVSTVTLNAVTVTAGQTVAWEPLGQADGRESARFRLVGVPVMPGQRILVAEPDPPSAKALPTIDGGGEESLVERVDDATGQVREWVPYHEVRTFALSLPADRHYVLDRAAGEIVFGDGVRGIAPPRGSPVAATYRHGAGAASNVPAAALSRMRSGVPGIADVRGVQDADGGSDPGGAAEAERRGPAALRHRGRAVTSTDICAIASEAAGGRVARCIVPTTDDRGQVSLVVVPSAPDHAAPSPSPALRAVIGRELAGRAAVALQFDAAVRVLGPSYRQVTVTTEVVPGTPDEAETVKARVLVALTRFIHALTGGPQATGWPLGRDVYESEVAQVLSCVPGVASIRTIQLSSAAAAQRLQLTSPVHAGLGLAVGSTVTGQSNQGLMVWTLDEPLPSGSRPDVLVVRGLTEGDRVHVVCDVTVVARKASSVGPGQLTLRLQAPPQGVVTFPIGSTLVTPDGTTALRLTRPVRVPARPVPVPAPGPLGTVSNIAAEGLGDGDLPTVSTRLVLVHPAELRVTRVGPTLAGDQVTVALAADLVEHVAPGTLLGLVGHPVRSPVVSAAPVTAGIDVTTPVWRSGDDLRVGEGQAGRGGRVAEARALDDVVHIDPGSLVWSGPHVVDLVAGGGTP